MNECLSTIQQQAFLSSLSKKFIKVIIKLFRRKKEREKFMIIWQNIWKNKFLRFQGLIKEMAMRNGEKRQSIELIDNVWRLLKMYNLTGEVRRMAIS
jgi:hypothetical protein